MGLTIYPDVIVLGTGRSGTSFVAGVLHNHFGVCMGHYSSQLPFETYYECQVMFDATVRLCGRFGVKSPKRVTSIEKWLECFTNVHEGCAANEACRRKLYGVKTKHMCWISPEYLIALKPRIIVRTWRHPHDSAKSFYERSQGKRRRKPLKRWIEIVESGEAALERLERQVTIPFVRIDIPRKGKGRLSEKELIEELDPYIKGLEHRKP